MAFGVGSLPFGFGSFLMMLLSCVILSKTMKIFKMNGIYLSREWLLGNKKFIILNIYGYIGLFCNWDISEIFF